MATAMRGPGEIAVIVWEVTKRFGRRPFQWAEFIEQAWFITSVTLMPTILVSIPFGAVISLQVGNLTGQLGAQSFAGATAVQIGTANFVDPFIWNKLTGGLRDYMQRHRIERVGDLVGSIDVTKRDKEWISS